jgi:hypothetical protein
VRRTSAALPRAALSVASLTVSATRAVHPDAAHTKTMFNTFYESTCSGARGSLKAVSCCAIALGLPAAAHARLVGPDQQDAPKRPGQMNRQQTFDYCKRLPHKSRTSLLVSMASGGTIVYGRCSLANCHCGGSITNVSCGSSLCENAMIA